MKKEDYLRKQICDIGNRLWLKGFTPSNSGNIVVKLSDTEYLATPHMVSKGNMTPAMIVKLRYERDKPEDERITVIESLSGYDTTSEIKIHLVAMDVIPEANATIHSHAPFAQVLSLLGVDAIRLPEHYAGAKVIRIVPWAEAGTWELAYGNVDALKGSWSKSVVMGCHGSLTTGVDLEDAYMKQEQMEHAAKVAYLYKTYTATP
ncbi:MAG: class II aldolase/adducin family protein [Lachnospiraceae bacterium]|nr:class II aldolase/adducin family protein [Lachnospiraceae bacterium]